MHILHKDKDHTLSREGLVEKKVLAKTKPLKSIYLLGNFSLAVVHGMK